jgi:hypothetical protein
MTVYTVGQFVANYYSNASHTDVLERKLAVSDFYGNTTKELIPAQYRYNYAGSASLGIGSKTYIMRGWYATGSIHEYWTTSSPTLAPPSGHTLTNITILSMY